VAAVDPARFDALVLIRGGGSKLDLEPFNDLGLCRLLARMPIPVLTGIGHDVDVSVADLIARSPHKTPTAVADHLVDKCVFFETQLNGFLVRMQHSMQDLFADHREVLAGFASLVRERPPGHCRLERGRLNTLAGQFGRLATARLQRDRQRMHQHTTDLGRLPGRLVSETEPARLAEARNALHLLAARRLQVLMAKVSGMDEAVRLLAPEKLLARGFSITRKQGAAVRDAAELREGDEIITELGRGRTWSTIHRIEPHG
jgi:exodeoxyribonuclease VII large subunit